MRILVVEDQKDLRETLTDLLRDEGYAVDNAADGEEGLTKALDWNYDAILLDIMLPKIDGFEFLERVREKKETPILMLTARGETSDRVSGLDRGADDYIPKPFEVDELLARLRAAIRRSNGKRNPVIAVGNVSIDTLARKVTKSGEPVELTAREFAIVETLANRCNEVVSRSYLYEHLFDENDHSLSNLLDVFIYKLRQKLGKDFIRTRRGSGYIVEA